MAFEGLTEKLSAAFKKLRGKGRLNEADVKEAMKEIRMALLEADVNFKVVKQFTATVTERAVGADVLESLTPHLEHRHVHLTAHHLQLCDGGGAEGIAGHQEGGAAVCPDAGNFEPAETGVTLWHLKD